MGGTTILEKEEANPQLRIYYVSKLFTLDDKYYIAIKNYLYLIIISA